YNDFHYTDTKKSASVSGSESPAVDGLLETYEVAPAGDEDTDGEQNGGGNQDNPDVQQSSGGGSSTPGGFETDIETTYADFTYSVNSTTGNPSDDHVRETDN